MSDDAQDQIIAERGLRADALLRNELFQEANMLLAKAITDAFARTDPRNEKELAYQRRLLQAQLDFNQLFAQFVHDGKNAVARIKDNERQSLLRRLVA